MNKLFLFLAAAGMMYACGGAPSGQETGETVHAVSIDALVEDPMGFEGQTVRFEGVIDHMCRHSGDKMRVAHTGEDAMSIQVRLGELMNRFSVEDEGRMVDITGVLKTEVLNMEELHQHDEDHACETTEEAVRMMAELGIDPNIRPYVELQDFELY